MEKKNNIKKIIVLLFFLLIILISIIIYLASRNIDNDNTLLENTTDFEDTNKESNSTLFNQTQNTIQDKVEESNLKKVSDTYTYLLVNYCLTDFYNYNDNVDISLDFIDKEVIEKLKLNENNFINLENSGFCIDEIYKQNLKEDESIYIAKYRLGDASGNTVQKVSWIRINDTDNVFSIYPYEYLSQYNYLDLAENDMIQFENLEKIEKNENNIFDSSDINTNTEACIKELFRRYKFDLLMDLEHLYNTLDEEYKNKKFKNIEGLQQYINENKTDLYVDSLQEYSLSDYDTYIQVTGKGQEGKYYIFNVTNFMDYTMYMDNYTVMTIEDEYNGFLPNSQAKYCIYRVIQAINDKNYEFVYEKLNPIQKNNYYKNIEDFKNFINSHFYEKSNYEIDNEYLIISSDIYQYNVTIKDAKENDFSYKRLEMTITLKENADFVIAINEKKN